MNDEMFEIRELAICTIGRLSSMNPAYSMPSLRKTIVQVSLVSKLEFLYDPADILLCRMLLKNCLLDSC